MKNAGLFCGLSKQSLDALEAETSSIQAVVGHAFNCVFKWLYFQYKIIRDVGRLLRGHYALEAGCGAGKTIIAAKVAKKHARKGKKTIFVCPSWAAMCAGIRRTFLKVNFKEEELGEVNKLGGSKVVVYFMTPRMLVNLIDESSGTFSRGVGLLVIDESHHFPRGREDLSLHGRVGDYAREFGRRRVVLLMTATHGRSDGDFPMGIKKPNARITTKYLVNKGHCPKICGVTTHMDIGDAKIDRGADTYSVKHEGRDGKKYWDAVVYIMVQIYNEYKYSTCAFVHRVADAELVVEQFNKKSGLGKRGLIALTGHTPQKERDRIDAAIRSGELLGYVTCGVGAESVDIPELTVCHLICRTKSIIRLVQAIGRVLRWTSSKKFALVIDYHIKKPDVIRACLGLADYAINVGVPKSKANKFKVVDVIVGKSENEEPNLTPVIRDIEDWIFKSAESSSNKKKKILLSMRSGVKRPRSREELGQALSSYTCTSSGSYDYKFDAEIRKKQPQWFINTADEKKKKLLKMKRGDQKPKLDTELGNALRSYTKTGGDSFDSGFNDKIRKKQPQWFIRSRMPEKRKKQLLGMKKGVQRPHRSGLGGALTRFTTPGSAFDPEFNAKIRKKQPKWFIKSSDRKKKELLKIKKGMPRPNVKTELGSALCTYTVPSGNFDPKFNAKIRKKHPKWFFIRVEDSKRILLAMKKGSQKPSFNTAIGKALCSYTRPGNNHRHSDFNAKIRKKQPKWFINSADEKRKQLLAIKKGGPRPSQRNKLGQALSSYTTSGGRKRHPKFNAKIRKKQPQWFK